MGSQKEQKKKTDNIYSVGLYTRGVVILLGRVEGRPSWLIMLDDIEMSHLESARWHRDESARGIKLIVLK